MLPLVDQNLRRLPQVWVPPIVWTDGTRLFWPLCLRTYGQSKTPNYVTLEKFVTLADSDPDDIVGFASRWGPLGICAEHGLPHWTDRGCLPALRVEFVSDDGKWEYASESEPLSAWHQYADQFRAILSLAREVNIGRLGDKGEWAKIAGGSTGGRDYTDPEFDESDAWCTIFSKIEEFLEIVNLTPQLESDNGVPHLEVRGKSLYHLFEALSLLLVTEVASVNQSVICSNCGKWRKPERSPNPKRRNYCSEECRKKGNALAARRYRQRRREKRT